MATGNDTLVSSDSEVYQANLALEKEFGGESIIVMYENDNLKDLLTLNNLKHMEGLEQLLEANENIYSIISPVMLMNQMSGGVV
jgi:predicted RND superfamily exporter protein